MNLDSMLLISVASRSLTAGTPLLLGTLGEILAERSGVINLGIEGVMAVGAITGFAVATATGSPWAGLAAAGAAGALLALIHAFFTVTLATNQIVTGLALSTLGLGLSSLFGKGYINRPLTARFQPITIPFLEDIPGLGPVLFQRDPVFYLALALVAVGGVVLHRTRWGIALRTVGENPVAAASLGVSVVRWRYAAVITGGALAGMAGGYLSLAYLATWIEGMTAGRGWIIVALTVFSLWEPRRAVIGAFLFGGVEVAQFSLQGEWISPQWLKMAPYLATLGVLWLAMRRRGGPGHGAAPAALTVPWTGEAR
jgi:general nucleoside transport system permease protein